MTNFDVGNKLLHDLQGLSPDNDISHDSDVSLKQNGLFNYPTTPSKSETNRPLAASRPHHHQDDTKPQIFKGRFQHPRKPFKPLKLGVTPSLFRGNTGRLIFL